jgi:hypothetical protein
MHPQQYDKQLGWNGMAARTGERFWRGLVDGHEIEAPLGHDRDLEWL